VVDPTGVERKLAAILSADVVGYSRLMAEDEVATVRTLTAYREEIGVLVRQHRGRVVDSPGDNLLAEFPSALAAVQAAVEIQRVIRARNAALPTERRMEFRVGVHLGDVMVEGERIYGDGLNIAARLEALAEPGGICVSGTVHEQVRSKLGLAYRDLGEQAFHNIPEPVHAYGIRTEAAPPAEIKPTREGRRTWVALAAVLVAALALAAAWIWGPSLGSRSPALDAGSIRSLAVLPLENISGDPEQDYFTDGMTEALIADLGKIASLRVISRTSIMQYRGVHRPLPEIGRELNVDAIIEGSVIRADDGVRITAQLIDARTDHHLWAESYQRELEDVLALQKEVARAIAEEVQAKLTPEEEALLRETRRVDPTAYEMYLRGRSAYDEGSPAALKTAVRYYEEAARVDPEFAAPHAGIADAFT
jgi:TolB-like protein/class 3 adenylate cyclase